ncbi:MAG: hypothetical protein AAFX03_04900 [Pseudomonadota bacterium]
MTEVLVRRAGLVSLMVAALLVALVSARPIAREIGAPAEFRYMPQDASVIVFVPDPATLLARAHVQLCAFLEDARAGCYFRPAEQPEDGLISEVLIDEFGLDADEDSLAILGLLGDIDAIGIDPAKPMLFAMRGPPSASDFTLIASLAAREAACEQLNEFLQDEFDFDFEDASLAPCEVGETADWNAVDPYAIEDKIIHFKRLADGRVAFYTDAAAFGHVLQSPPRAAGLFAQDQFSAAFASLVAEGETSLWAYARHPGLSVGAPAIFALSFDPAPDDVALEPGDLETAQAAFRNAIGEASFPAPDFLEGGGGARLSAWVAPSAYYSHTTDQFLNAPVQSGLAFSDLGYGANATVAARDVMRYARFADYGFSDTLSEELFTGPDAAFPALMKYGAILGAAQDLRTIDAVNIELAGFQDRVPDLALRLAMDETEAAALIETIQEEEQIARDIAVLAGAVPERDLSFWRRDCEDPDRRAALRSAIEDLAADGLLQARDTPGGFAHLWCEDIRPAFQEPAYVGCIGGGDACEGRRRFRFLQPPLNEDDVQHRFARAFERGDVEGDLEETRRALVEDDRFRLVSVFDDDTSQLWIASDLSLLARSLDREGPEISVRDRFRAVLSPDRLHVLLASQEYDDAEADGLHTLAALFDELSVYDTITLSAAPAGRQSGTRFDVVFSR